MARSEFDYLADDNEPTVAAAAAPRSDGAYDIHSMPDDWKRAHGVSYCDLDRVYMQRQVGPFASIEMLGEAMHRKAGPGSVRVYKGFEVGVGSGDVHQDIVQAGVLGMFIDHNSVEQNGARTFFHLSDESIAMLGSGVDTADYVMSGLLRAMNLAAEMSQPDAPMLQWTFRNIIGANCSVTGC